MRVLLMLILLGSPLLAQSRPLVVEQMGEPQHGPVLAAAVREATAAIQFPQPYVVRLLTAPTSCPSGTSITVLVLAPSQILVSSGVLIASLTTPAAVATVAHDVARTVERDVRTYHQRRGSSVRWRP